MDDQTPVKNHDDAEHSANNLGNETGANPVLDAEPMHLPSFLESSDRRFLRSFTVWSVSAMFAFSMLIGMVRVTGNIGTFAMRSFAQATSALLPQDEHGHVNVLLLGVGDKSHAAANLTDSIMVASIDPDTQSVVLLSLPRDLYVEDAKDAPAGRINALYVSYKNKFRKVKGETESGASLLAMQSLADDIGMRLGTDIHGVLKMDFVGFTEIVDAVGGVDIEVKEKIVDYTYPVKEGVLGIFSMEKGPQHLDGTTALQYARSRHSTSDFDRSTRQQQILAAIGDKVKTMDVLGNAEVIGKIETAIRTHFETTFGRGELFALAGTLASVPRDHILSMHLNYRTGGDYADAEAGGFVRSPAPGEFSGAILLPYSLTRDISDWSQIRTFANLIFGERDMYFRNPLLLFDSSDARPVHARRLKNELIRYGFRVEEFKTEKDEERETESSIVVMEKGDEESAELLSELLALPLTQSDDEQESATGATIRITLGKEYMFTSFAKVWEMKKVNE